MKTFKRLCCGTLAALTAVLMFPTASLAADVGQEATLYQVSHKRTSNTLDIAPIMTDTHFVVRSDVSTGRDTLYDMEGYCVFTAGSGDVITDASNRFLVCAEDYILDDGDDVIHLTPPSVYAYEIGKWDEKIGPYNDISISGDGKYLIASDDYGVHIIGGDSVVDLDGYMGYSAGDDYVGIIDFDNDDNISSKLYNISTRKTVTLPDDIVGVRFAFGSTVGIGTTDKFGYCLIGSDGKNVQTEAYLFILPLDDNFFVGLAFSDYSKVLSADYEENLPNNFRADMINSEGKIVNSFNSQLPIGVFGEYVLLANSDETFTLCDPKLDKIISLGDWAMKLADGSLVITNSNASPEENYGAIYSADGKFIENAPCLYYSKDESGTIYCGKTGIDDEASYKVFSNDSIQPRRDLHNYGVSAIGASEGTALISYLKDGIQSEGLINKIGEDLIPVDDHALLTPYAFEIRSIADIISTKSLYHKFENGAALYIFTNSDGTTEYYIITFDTIPFYDVEKSQWFYDAVNYSFDASLMRGTASTVFEPDTSMTRAMFVTVLHRLEGESKPSENYVMDFTDVESDSWYGEALMWAAENGIVNGTTDTTFEPDASITREQIATMMYRYVRDYKEKDVSEKADLSAFPDVAKVSYWAKDSLEWAKGVGLISGKKEPNGQVILAPEANTTRAEVSTILMRYNNK